MKRQPISDSTRGKLENPQKQTLKLYARVICDSRDLNFHQVSDEIEESEINGLYEVQDWPASASLATDNVCLQLRFVHKGLSEYSLNHTVSAPDALVIPQFN